MTSPSLDEVDRLGREAGSFMKKRKHMSDNTKYSVVMTGSAGCGKSSVTLRFVHDEFDEEYNPTVTYSLWSTSSLFPQIEDSYMKEINVDFELGILDINDTAGSEEFAYVQDPFVRYLTMTLSDAHSSQEC